MDIDSIYRVNDLARNRIPRSLLMRTAYIYFIEFPQDDEKFTPLLKKSLDLLIKNISDPKDIFINMRCDDGPKKDDLLEYCKSKEVSVFDVTEGIPTYGYKRILGEDNNIGCMCLSNSKITNLDKLIGLGYDRVINLDVDIFFFSQTDIFNNLSDDGDTFYALKLPSRYNECHNKQTISDCIISREPIHNPIFSFCNSLEKHSEYTHLKKMCHLLLDYNIDNYAIDIQNLGYWPNNGIIVFNKNFINKYFKTLSLLNYFVTKDDEMIMMLCSFAKNIKYLPLDIDSELSFNYKELDTMDIKILHPCGHDQKMDFIKEKLSGL